LANDFFAAIMAHGNVGTSFGRTAIGVESCALGHMGAPSWGLAVGCPSCPLQHYGMATQACAAPWQPEWQMRSVPPGASAASTTHGAWQLGGCPRWRTKGYPLWLPLCAAVLWLFHFCTGLIASPALDVEGAGETRHQHLEVH